MVKNTSIIGIGKTFVIRDLPGSRVVETPHYHCPTLLVRVLSDSLGVFLDHREPFLPVDLIHMFVCLFH